MKKVFSAIQKGLILSCHDLSEGGLGIALSEMALSGDIGVNVDLQNIVYTGEHKRFDFMLFSESNTRFLIEVSKQKEKAFQKILADATVAKIGTTTEERNVKVNYGDKILIDLPISVIRAKFLRKVV